MGLYLNPGNSGFTAIRKTDYVDKTGMIALLNNRIGTKQKLVCVSRPRRFGKSFAAQMLCAYYDRSCSSADLFEELDISSGDEKITHYGQYINHFDVLYWDMTGIMAEADDQNMISFLKGSVISELEEEYPFLDPSESFLSILLNVVNKTRRKFVFIIDEWDAPIREKPAVQDDYLKFLRSLFKNSSITDQIVAAAYMTGILPIKKDGSQSAISDFDEYTMIAADDFAPYVGFTEEEVKQLCCTYHRDFSETKQWYDGYSMGETGSVYNPNSVMKAMRYGRFRSYWTQTAAAESLMDYISMDFDGLSRTTAELLGGISVEIDTNGFSNDLVTFRGRDDVLTLLVHLGYLSYEEETGTVRIPNEEIRLEFARAVREDRRMETMRRVRESDQLILDTVTGREEAVAAQIEKIHREETAPLFYNNEQSLRSVIKLAYFSYKDQYLKFEELPSGDGYADIVYLPKKQSSFPALVIELKWNQDAEGAIHQICEKKYPEALDGYGGDIQLVGISYNRDTQDSARKHKCKIQKWSKK